MRTTPAGRISGAFASLRREILSLASSKSERPSRLWFLGLVDFVDFVDFVVWELRLPHRVSSPYGRGFQTGIKFAVCIPLFAVFILDSAGAAEQQRPNIVFIFSDDHANQAIGAYGGPLAALNPTPNIDSMAGEGMRFNHFYVGNSICLPSRATVLTGKHSHKNGKRRNLIDFDYTQQTFPKLLQSAGYQTAIVGKIHLGGRLLGFDHWEVMFAQGRYYNPEFVSSKGPTDEVGYATDLITQKSLDWLENERDPKKPFMLMIQHKGTHHPWSPALRHIGAFEDVEIPYPDNFWDDYASRGTAARKQNLSIAKTMKVDEMGRITANPASGKRASPKKDHQPTRPPRDKRVRRMNEEQRRSWKAAYGQQYVAFEEKDLEGDDLVRWKYQRFIKDYLRTALSVDESVGRILTYLKKQGLDENTVVIYSSDQGFFLGEHGWFDKRFMYTESFRTPMVVRWPGVIEPGSINDDLCQNIDLAETFLDLAGVPIPEDMQGMSLVPLFKGKSPTNWRHSVYYHYYEYPGPHNVRKHEGVASKRFKLIRFYGEGVPGGEEWELYDLEKDPREMNNAAARPEFRAKLAEMKQLLRESRLRYDVQ